MATRAKVKIIKWSDPPKANSSHTVTTRKKKVGWDLVLAKLAEKPGQWALVRTSDHRIMVTQIHSKDPANRKFRGYEFVTRKYYVGNKAKYGVWARKKAPQVAPKVSVKEQFIDLTDAL